MKVYFKFLLFLISFIYISCDNSMPQRIDEVYSDMENYPDDFIENSDMEVDVDSDANFSTTDEDDVKPDEDTPVPDKHDEDEYKDEGEPLDVSVPEEEPPVDLPGVNFKFFPDLSYGDEEEQLMDLYLPDTEKPAPFVVFYHGGGFVAGDKKEVHELLDISILEDLLKNGVAVISVNYRLLEEKEDVGLIKPLSDCRRALQFLRYNSEKLRLEKEKTVLMGLSAGAGSSMWVAFNKDMADSENSDPVRKESTRVNAVVAIETQATYDLVKWETEIYEPFGITLEMASNFGFKKTIYSFYAIDSMDELYTPEIEKYRKKVDMLDLMTEDDPEVFVFNAHQNAGHPGADFYSLLHHPRHAEVLKNRAEETNMKGRFYAPALGIEDSSGEWIVPFILRNIL
ncbi:MAG: alpha/beta hydrolase [bacterium]